jgi:tetratricopeptide (TPR) repeat protein
LILFAAGLACADTAREYYARGVELLKTGKDSEAAAAFERVVSVRPDLLPVRVLYGLALFRSGEAARGEREARAVLGKDAQNPQALHLLGLCLLRQDRMSEGAEALESALRRQPDNVDAAATLATVYAARGDVDKAEELLRALPGRTERPEGLLIRGIVEKARNNWVSAARSLEAALKQNPKLPVAHAELGHTYLLMGESARAEHAFLDELKIQPGDFHASVYLAWHYLKERRYREALPLLDAASSRRPDHAGVAYMHGQARHALGEHTAAAELLERAVNKEPDFAPAHVLLARVYAKLGRLEDARREQAVVSRLNDEQQQRSLGSGQSYGTASAVPQLGAR